MANANEVTIQVPDDRKTICEVCNKDVGSTMGLGVHISLSHSMSYEDYVIMYYNNNEKPKCVICENHTRFIRKTVSFKKYCVEHANQSRADWSKNNGYGAKQEAGWKRGLTKENSDVVRRHSEWMTGQNNPMHKDNPRNKKDDDANS